METSRYAIFFILVLREAAKADPASELALCMDNGGEINECLKITMAALKQFMSTGIPEAGLPPLDPMRLDNVELNLAGAVVSFNNVTAIGLSNHEARNVQYDRNTRTMMMTLALPKLTTSGEYVLKGKVLNIEGLDSKGPYQNEYSGVSVQGEAEVEQNGNSIKIGDLNFRLKIDKINVHLECLFPKPNKNCCEDKDFRSCNPIFARTIHRIVNSNKSGGNSFVDNFQDEISDKIGNISKVYLNRALENVNFKYFI